MKAAYADPPYIGLANYYPEKTEVDHLELIKRLCAEYDCWALSCYSNSLKEILKYCPDDVRVAAWVKPFCAFKRGINPAYAWEPVIFWHPRPRAGKYCTVRDWISANITLQKGVKGAKPEGFCYWLFNLLGLRPCDTLDDLYPGTGVVKRCFNNFMAMQTVK